jgi:decaprenylphospho-beta-D-erythro-pentofuranosid-2-ulose 2-reductase
VPSSTSKPIRVAIFGATSDIANAVARRLAEEEGARLVLIARDAAALAAAAADLKVRGAVEVCTQHGDFADSDNLATVADAAWSVLSGLDLVLIAYGTLPDQNHVTTDVTAAREALTINFLSPVLLCGALASRFEAQKFGTIAVITSVAGERGRQSNYVYGAAKGGLQRYLEGLRHRLFGAGVAVIDIRPGFVATKMTAALAQGGPLWATPDAVASDILAAIRKRKSVLYTPWFWRLIMLIVRNVPNALFHRSAL